MVALYLLTALLVLIVVVFRGVEGVSLAVVAIGWMLYDG